MSLLARIQCAIAILVLGVFGVTAVAETHQVTITDNVYTPQNLTVAPGDTVVWTNAGSDHTVTANDDLFHYTLEFGHLVSHTFDVVGRYPYYCQLHGGPG